MRAITIVLFVTYVAMDSRRVSKTSLRIYNGVDDKLEKYPYVVAFKDINSVELCTGTLIMETWVLTAAHCFRPDVQFIQYGNMSKSIEQTKSKSVVLKMISHPGHKSLENPALDINDIGLVMVQRVNMPKYARISAVNYKSLLGQPVECAGFGSTYLGSQWISRNEYALDNMRPRQIAEGIVKTCDGFDFFNKMIICVASRCSQIQLVLPGDAGGPLFFDNKLVGVASAYDDNIFEYGFTPVSPYLSWIQSVVSSSHKITTIPH